MTTFIYEIDNGFDTRYEYIIAKNRTKAKEILNKIANGVYNGIN